MKKYFLFIIMLLTTAVYAQNTSNVIPSPAWTKYLVICEIATKGYTSPNGAESAEGLLLENKENVYDYQSSKKKN